MKVCLSSTSSDLEGRLDPRFGRCAYLLIVDTKTHHFEAVPNVAVDQTSGAGIQAAQAIADKGVRVVLTGNVGPNAFKALSAAGIEVLTTSGSVREVLAGYEKGELEKTAGPTVDGHFGNQNGQGWRR
jgi:predicted Fe-Mo cluster-binding NifX family protein